MIAELPAETATKGYGQILCSGVRIVGRFKGEPCKELLLRADIDVWETILSDTTPRMCSRCKTKYVLADFL